MAIPAMLAARLIGLVALMSATTLPTGAHAAAAPSLPRCAGVAVSPAFPDDGTAFCAAVFPTSSTTSTVKLYVTHNRGKTWTTTSPSGFVSPSPLIEQFLISPDFATDRMLVVRFPGDAVYYSLDAGATFTKAPTPFGAGRITLAPSSLPALPVTTAAATAVDHAVILSAVHGGSAGQNDSYVFDPVVPSLRLVSGTPDIDEAFFPSPDYANDHTAFAVGWRAPGTPASSYAELFSCTPTFTCAAKTYTFAAPYDWVDQLQFAPDYATSGAVLVTVTSTTAERFRVLVSHDRGAHFSAVVPVQQALAKLYAAGGVGTVAIAAGPKGSRSLFAYLTGGDGRTHAPPADQLYRSDDDGHTWSLVAYNRCRCSAHGAGVLPYGNLYASRADAITPAGVITAAGSTMMLTSMLLPRVGPGITTVWCSSDLGRTWVVPCR